MPDRIRLLVKRISETRPVQSARRQILLSELRAVRRDLDVFSAPQQANSLDAAMLLMEFMNRSEDVATSETLAIVANLVATVDEHLLRSSPARAGGGADWPMRSDVTEHQDLRLTQESLLGSILLQAGVISPESLARALQMHASSGRALGQCLLHLGAASLEQIAAAIAYQDRMREEARTTRAEPERNPLGGMDPQRSDKLRGFVQSMHTQVLGEVLIRLGTITREQLVRALELQRAANVHIGEALVETGATSWEQVKKGLDVQKQLRRAA